VKVGARNLLVPNRHTRMLLDENQFFIYFKQMKVPASQPRMKRQIIQIIYDISKSVTKFKHTLHKEQRRV
jgi:hypothetical protein